MRRCSSPRFTSRATRLWLVHYNEWRPGHSTASLLNRLSQLAIKAGMWTGQNPILQVDKRKVPKGLHQFLTFEEVPLVLQALDEKGRPLFATAIYTGMRKGELLGLRRGDVHIDDRTIDVCRSYTNDTTKGGHADLIPLADDLVPFLKTALERSKSELVFPKPEDMKSGVNALDLKVN